MYKRQVLYLVYTNDLPVLPGVTLSLFADDAMSVSYTHLDVYKRQVLHTGWHEAFDFTKFYVEYLIGINLTIYVWSSKGVTKN